MIGLILAFPIAFPQFRKERRAKLLRHVMFDVAPVILRRVGRHLLDIELDASGRIRSDGFDKHFGVIPYKSEIWNRGASVEAEVERGKGSEQVKFPDAPVKSGCLEIANQIAVEVDYPRRHFTHEFVSCGRVSVISQSDELRVKLRAGNRREQVHSFERIRAHGDLGGRLAFQRREARDNCAFRRARGRKYAKIAEGLISLKLVSRE